MKLENDILNELQLLSPLLAGLPKSNAFTVPDGYFDAVSATILLCIKEDAGIINAAKTADIPEGYFENLSSNILNKIKEQQINTATNEPTAVSALLQSVQHSNKFEVPQGYFDNLSSDILNKIKEQQINAATDELQLLSPLLHSIKHINVFEVPEGYFNKVPTTIFHLVNATPAKVVSMPTLRLVVKYAAAAVFTGAMALGVYKYTETPAAINTVPAVSFATLDTSIEKGKAMNEEQFNEALNNLTKDDITSYLEKNGSDEDISLLTSSSDVNGLPNKDDYLLDDKTLENYLDKIKFQN
jgi:hypothetical protein